MSTWVNQNAIFLSLPIEQLLAITAYGEAASEGAEEMMGVLNVVNNRASNVTMFGDTEIYNLTGSPYHAVVLKQKQFSMFNIGNTVRPTAERMASNFETEVMSNGILGQAYDLAIMLLNSQLSDNTGGATYYHATYVNPSWASSMTMLGKIGNHVFYSSPRSIIASLLPSSYVRGSGESQSQVEMGIQAAGFGNIAWFLIIGAGIGIIFQVLRKTL